MLKEEHIEELKNKLLEKKQKILQETTLSQSFIEELHSDTKGDDLDFAEVSSDAYNLSILQDKQLEELREIEHALKKIENGTYNICEMCDEPVGIKRLRAKPHARFCIYCRPIYEKEQKA
ncbi:RNA polymerase-binding protein DksA [Arcobacter lacus]|uniref:RNA polymerase-binding protein DksA n=1 Tax=Arcobacter lacus TaxID=1912876 RepID=UPI0021BAC301|nr:RNA polymerase-binding protein DksA [Arcobacter lacus]MCT7910546.1 RNA polymerase-binding protein DksA [Arcobacter lacus]